MAGEQLQELAAQRMAEIEVEDPEINITAATIIHSSAGLQPTGELEGGGPSAGSKLQRNPAQ
jgi:hypothetical protein